MRPQTAPVQPHMRFRVAHLWRIVPPQLYVWGAGASGLPTRAANRLSSAAAPATPRKRDS